MNKKIHPTGLKCQNDHIQNTLAKKASSDHVAIFYSKLELGQPK